VSFHASRSAAPLRVAPRRLLACHSEIASHCSFIRLRTQRKTHPVRDNLHEKGEIHRSAKICRMGVRVRQERNTRDSYKTVACDNSRKAARACHVANVAPPVHCHSARAKREPPNLFSSYCAQRCTAPAWKTPALNARCSHETRESHPFRCMGAREKNKLDIDTRAGNHRS